MSRFFITTPIYYINAEPHLGHAYTTMVADTVARAHRLNGDDVFFLTGTDEHGQKVERAAQKSGLSTTAFADHTSQKFRDMLPALNISNDDFIRTTEPRHHAGAQALWRRVRDRGHIYKGKYEGWYCTVDEIFVPDQQLQNGRCPICGGAVERIAEESYFFRLSAFQDKLREHYRQHEDFVTPKIRQNEVLSFLEAGLEDLSVSRTSFRWGIPVPDDPAHVMYVWFDALTNYLTAAGYGAPDAASQAGFEARWPADVHLIGKEIVRQHAIYWPAFLMAADLPLPRQVVSHGWWLMEGAKISKSRGNVVRPPDYVERFGLDALRYFVCREMTFGQDANFTDEAILTRYNSDLANDLGNLVSRAITMVHRYRGGSVPAPDAALCLRPEEASLGQVVDAAIDRVKDSVASFQLSLALREIWDVISATNRYIVAREPWTLSKDPSKRAELDTALYVAADTVRVVGELLRPFMPQTGERMLQVLGTTPSATSWTDLARNRLAAGTPVEAPQPLFPRIDLTVEELRHMSADQPEVPPTTAPSTAVPSSAEAGSAAASGAATSGAAASGAATSGAAASGAAASGAATSGAATSGAAASGAATSGAAASGAATSGVAASGAATSGAAASGAAASGAATSGAAASGIAPSTPVLSQAPSTPAPHPAPSTPAPSTLLSIDDFMKVELRVAKVLAAERVPKSQKLLKLLVNLGTEQRTIVAGLAEAYEADAVVGRTVVVVCNLKPAKLMGVESNGMVLAASPDGGKPILVAFEDAPPPGARVR